MKELQLIEDAIAEKVARVMEEEAINASYSCPEERIVAEKLTLVHNRMIVADIICDTNLVTFVYPNDSIEDIIENFKEQRFNSKNSKVEELISNFINEELSILEEEETLFTDEIELIKNAKIQKAIKLTSDFKVKLKSYKDLQDLLKKNTIKRLSDRGL